MHWYLIPCFGVRTTASDAHACVRIGYTEGNIQFNNCAQRDFG